MALPLEDATAAFKLVRSRAKEWKIDPNRIGMMGFSAGAGTTMAATLQSKENKPAFIAPIYGSLRPVEVPPDAPPMFVALAADDPLQSDHDLRPDVDRVFARMRRGAMRTDAVPSMPLSILMQAIREVAGKVSPAA